MVKKLVFRILILFVPFLISLPIYWFNYETPGGDLSRVGRISVDSDYHDIIREQYEIFDNLYTEWHPGIVSGYYDVITIGDSFSMRGKYGYQNFMSNYDKNLKVLNISNHYLKSTNPLQEIVNLLNGDFFDNIHADFIILEAVERTLNIRAEDINIQSKLNIKDIKEVNLYSELSSLEKVVGEIYDANYYSLTNLLYNFDDNAFFSEVHLFESNRKLFQFFDGVLIFSDDIRYLKHKNNLDSIINLNDFLNELNDLVQLKDMKLIFLPAPDKYTIYQDYFVTNDYIRSDFFPLLNSLEKNYLYVDTYSLLLNQIENNLLDIYYYDDTHWSPVGSKIVAEELLRMIENNEIKNQD